MKNQKIIDLILAKRGKLWSKTGSTRYYLSLDHLLELGQLKLSFYGSGNISQAMYEGEQISNSAAGPMYAKLQNAKCYFEVETGKIYSNTLSCGLSNDYILGVLQEDEE